VKLRLSRDRRRSCHRWLQPETTRWFRLLKAAAVDRPRWDVPKMATVHVILVGGVNDGGAVGAQRYVLHIEITRRKECGGTAVGADGVEVITAVLLRSEDDPAVDAEVKRDVRRQPWKRILRPVSTLPDDMSGSSRRIGQSREPRVPDEPE